MLLIWKLELLKVSLRIAKISVRNNKTNNVVYLELRTRPGQLYSKSNVVRTIRELGQLGFFDAQKFLQTSKM